MKRAPTPEAMTEEIELARFEGEGGAPVRALAPAAFIRVRRATSEDLPALVRMAVRFVTESSYRGFLMPNVGQLQALSQFVLDHGAGFVAQVDGGDDVVGMLGMSLVPHVMSGELVACEAAWWVEPEFRGGSAAVRLLSAAERWARESGAVWAEMIAPAGNDRLCAFYRRRGYLEVETVFRKKLAA